MGLIQSSPQVPEEQDINAVFVVPGYLNFTTRQLAMMVEAGQQPGVPFRIGGAGAVRPRGERKLAQIANNLVNLKKSSLKLTEEGKLKYSLRFSYDAKVDCRATIYLGAKDKTTGQRIRIGSAIQLWGPLVLKSGLNQEWNSKVDDCIVDSTFLPGLEVKSGPDAFDVVVILDPTDSIYAIREHRKKLLEQNELRENAVRKSSSVIRMKRVGSNEALSSSGGGGAGGNTGTGGGSGGGNGGADLKDLNWANKEILLQATFARVVTPGKSDVRLRVVFQKAQTESGVFLVQDIFGMDNPEEQEEEEGAGNGTAAAAAGDGGEAGGASSGAAAVANDTDANECVICLTDPREVAVFPCRHMCLCSVCAEALPSQANKCPICRREATLLLRLHQNAPLKETEVPLPPPS